jgi:hypothetical protein|tara:strand:- start:28 stop:690 length:663 start_codon:yes stop_codon:yes gene_type:complete
LRGRRYPDNLSVEDVRAALHPPHLSHTKRKQKESTADGTIDTKYLGSHVHVTDYLNRYDIDYPDIPVMYDSKEHRVVFLIENSRGEYVDGIGRATSKYRFPKWKRYCASDAPVILPFSGQADNKSSKLYIVEDIVSAWKIVKHIPGCPSAMALLGTSLSDKHLRAAWEYHHVVLCLDKDATNKSIAMSRRISMGVKVCSISMLDKDIKDMSIEEIQKCWT